MKYNRDGQLKKFTMVNELFNDSKLFNDSTALFNDKWSLSLNSALNALFNDSTI